MSFLRHREIYPSDGGKTLTGRAPAHRLDEFPTGYSLAGCSPAEPASASPASLILLRSKSFVYDVSANGNLSLIFVSHHRGAAQPIYTVTDRVAIGSPSGYGNSSRLSQLLQQVHILDQEVAHNVADITAVLLGDTFQTLLQLAVKVDRQAQARFLPEELAALRL